MLTYDKKMNYRGRQAVMVLRTAEEKNVIKTKRFMDAVEFDAMQKFLLNEKELWDASQQFVGRRLEVAVIE